jgi:hypothetical protein
MKLSEILTVAVQKSEIPLRFEPGAEEAVVAQVREVLRAWLNAHMPADPRGDFDYGRKAVLEQLLEEAEDARDVPG